MKHDIITALDINVDLLVKVNESPEFDQKEKLVQDYNIEMGGSSCIFACQAAKLGLKTAGLGVVGEDSFGSLVLEKMTQAGVDTEHIRLDNSIKTGVSVILCKENDRSILTYLGTNDAVTGRDFTPQILGNARHLHIGSYFLIKGLQPCYKEIVIKAKENGMTISMDTNWDPEELWDGGLMDILPYVDVFLPNSNEAMAITGKTNLEDAVSILSGIVPVVAVKLGKDGAAVYSGGETYMVKPLDVKVVDTVGAGDSFDGGFVYGYLSGFDLQDCLRIGSICGSMNTTRHGGIAGQPLLKDVMDMKVKYYD